MPITSAIELLQSATQDQHKRLGILPFFHAAASQRLTITSYLALLQGMAAPHQILEQLLDAQAAPALLPLWDAPMHKLHLIQHDIAALQSPSLAPIKAALLRGSVFAEQIRLRAQQDPISLAGTIYALMLWNFGGATLSQQIAHSCHLNSYQGLSYLASYDSWGATYWAAFAQRVNTLLGEPASCERAIAAAREAFDAIDRLIDVLYPLNTNTYRELSTSINPIAGNHQVADNLREIEAAMQADAITWQQFPYLELRYGKRGREYGWSDSAWLVSLCEMNVEKIQQQVHWFGSLLSNRGMPQWLTEQHLLSLYEEVVKSTPERQADYAKLQFAAGLLRDIRLAHISDEAFWSVARSFDQQVGPEWSAWLRGTGELLASAVADEKTGIVKAVESLEGWLTDPARFPAAWITSVHSTIRQAREACH